MDLPTSNNGMKRSPSQVNVPSHSGFRLIPGVAKLTTKISATLLSLTLFSDCHEPTMVDCAVTGPKRCGQVTMD